MPSHPALDVLRAQAHALTRRAHAPFSGAPAAATLLLDDGRWVPGVRVESASYGLTLPALLNAYTTAVAAEVAARGVAMVLSRPFRREEALYVDALSTGPYEAAAEDAWIRGGWTANGALPTPEALLSPTLDASIGASPQAGLAHVREIAERAHVPASHYPVGTLLECEHGALVPGVNVEHPDWARILCAERAALGTVHSYDLPSPQRLFLSCTTDPHGTPCGACRQLLAELAPDTTIWMDRHATAPEQATASELLPGSFRGRALLQGS